MLKFESCFDLRIRAYTLSGHIQCLVLRYCIVLDAIEFGIDELDGFG